MLASVTGCAVHAKSMRGREYTTLEIKVNYVHGVTVDSGDLAAQGRVVHTGRHSTVAEGKVTHAKGRLCATGSTTCLVFDLPTV